jgi:hypothetical protein
MLAKHKVVGSTPITRSKLKPLGNQGLLCFWGREAISISDEGFTWVALFLILFFDKIAVIVGLFDVFGVVGSRVFMLSPVWLEMKPDRAPIE